MKYCNQSLCEKRANSRILNIKFKRMNNIFNNSQNEPYKNEEYVQKFIWSDLLEKK